MSSRANDVVRRLDPGAPAHEYFEVVWRTSSDGAFKRAGLLAWEIIGIAVGLHSADEVQPIGIDIRVHQGPPVAGFAYGEDRELARRHTALVERRLWDSTVGEFLTFLRETAAAPTARTI
ncbi:hypothetical protein OH768_10125 [Streptomyces sp. NBC_01622]|uniref:hypothetical protein n=1 Tax=Streptomyces sp. NBC_01622 TaxID=2975903 RepID=UPI0038672BC1|nr:hypothetical protein OH768_10125 [Streptomyces sp. NBC_01622]